MKTGYWVLFAVVIGVLYYLYAKGGGVAGKQKGPGGAGAGGTGATGLPG